MAQAPHKRPLIQKILFACLIVSASLFLLLISFGSWHAFFRPVPVPVIDTAADQLLVTTSTLARNDAGTSTTYQPFIALFRDLPTSLALARERLNARFDRVFRNIAQYERDKSAMDFKSSWTALEEIDKEYNAADLERINVGLGTIESRAMQYRQWYLQERIAVCARHQEWKFAVFMSRDSYQYSAQIESANYYRNHPAGDPFDRGAWERKAGEQAWDQEVYFWRQMGGAEGYYRIGSGAVERAYDHILQKTPSSVQHKLPARLDLN